MGLNNEICHDWEANSYALTALLIIEKVGLVVESLAESLAAVVDLVEDVVHGLLAPAERLELLEHRVALLPAEDRVERPRVDGAVARPRHVGQGHLVGPGDVCLESIKAR